jgi:hypothetical protein
MVKCHCLAMFSFIQTFWRRRFFVLYKSNEQDYRLKYFNSGDQKDRALGEIDLKQ